MSSFQALYNSLSGLFAFSSSLDTISNNISNMNTPGFQGSDSFYENVMEDLGTRVDGTGIRTTQGQIQQTGNATDLAIKGKGLFVLKDSASGQLYYTRAGQFSFDPDGYLVDTVSKYRVQGLAPDGTLQDIDIGTMRSLPASATSIVNVTGNLSPDDSTASVPSIKVYDAQGTAHTYSATLENTTSATPGSWAVTFKDDSGQTVGAGEIRFSTDGSIQSGYNTISTSLTLAGQAQTVTFNFGSPGTLNGASQFSGVPSNLSASPEDGHSIIGVSTLSFDEKGVLTLTYTDQETRQGSRVALASFEDESALQRLNGRLYEAPPNQQRQVGAADEGVFGLITGGSLEMSNVDLTRELGDMIVIQRGYQASSRVMTISNEMLQQLYDSTRGGG